MRMLNRSEKYTTTYGEDAAKYPFFQDGLYFANSGKLMDVPHNRSVYDARGQNIELDLTDTAPAAPPAPVDDALAGKTPAELFGISERIRAQLDVAEAAEGYPASDIDAYVPTMTAVDENLAFIRRHLTA